MHSTGIEALRDQTLRQTRRRRDNAHVLSSFEHLKTPLVKSNAARGTRTRFVAPEQIVQRCRVHGVLLTPREGPGHRGGVHHVTERRYAEGPARPQSRQHVDRRVRANAFEREVRDVLGGFAARRHADESQRLVVQRGQTLDESTDVRRDAPGLGSVELVQRNADGASHGFQPRTTSR